MSRATESPQLIYNQLSTCKEIIERLETAEMSLQVWQTFALCSMILRVKRNYKYDNLQPSSGQSRVLQRILILILIYSCRTYLQLYIISIISFFLTVMKRFKSWMMAFCLLVSLTALIDSFEGCLLSVRDSGAYLLVHDGSPESQSQLYPEIHSRDRPGSEMKKYRCCNSTWDAMINRTGAGGCIFKYF